VIPRNHTIFSPSPSGCEKDGQKKQNEEVIILGNGQLPVGRPEASKEKEEQAQGKQEPDKSLSQEHLMGNDLENIEHLEEFEVSDQQKEKANVEEPEKNPK